MSKDSATDDLYVRNNTRRSIQVEICCVLKFVDRCLEHLLSILKMVRGRYNQNSGSLLII